MPLGQEEHQPTVNEAALSRRALLLPTQSAMKSPLQRSLFDQGRDSAEPGSEPRVPLVSDARKPWEYPGWLMHYRIMLEEHPEIPQRWDYWCRTMAAGHLVDEPIPEIHFTGGGAGRSNRKATG
jgi:hypothetical protein